MAVFERIDYEGVEGVRVGKTNKALNTTCIVYRLGKTIIDTGPPNQWPDVKRFLEERETDKIIITHHHEDHSGNGGRAAAATNAPVLVPPSGLDDIRNGFKITFMQKRTWGKPGPYEAQAVPDDVPVADGIVLKTLHAPGHSHDMTCYLEPNRGWLFSGDVYIARNTKYFRYDENVHQQIGSLAFLLEQPFDTLLCSHRGVLHDGKDHLRSKWNYLVELRDRALELQSKGLSSKAVTKVMLGKEDAMAYMTFGLFSKGNLITSCLSHAHRDEAEKQFGERA